MTIVGAHCEGLPVAMHQRLDARHERQRAFILGAQLAHLEDVVGADLDAIFLALASIAIDDRREDAGVLLAFNVDGLLHASASEQAPYLRRAAANAIICKHNFLDAAFLAQSIFCMP